MNDATRGIHLTPEEVLRCIHNSTVGGSEKENCSARDHGKVPWLSTVYICSRYSGKDDDEVKRNVRQAQLFSRFAIKQRVVPVAPHLMYPGFLDDRIPKERRIGQLCGKWLLTSCDELWVFWMDGISSGMLEEINTAVKIGVKIRFFNGHHLLEEEDRLRELMDPMGDKEIGKEGVR